MLGFLAKAHAFSPEEDLTARSAVLMEAKTGRILYQREPDLHLPPASTTKILTAIVTLESGRKLTELLTVSKAATRVPASKLYLAPGQTLSIADLLYGILLSSANDASMVLAEGIGGSVKRFAEMMTKKAHDIGATNTNFTNPHGLTAPNHYSTARDLALIFQYAMKNPMFRKIVQTKISSVKSLTPGRKRPKTRLISVRNHNHLLWNFDGALGGKTGYTRAAQKCFVGAVGRGGVTLIVSILGSHNLWGDTKRLLEYGFDNYNTLKLAAQPKSTAPERAAIVPAAAVTSEGDGEPDVEGYILQLGSFREADRADSLLKTYNDKGFAAYVEKASLEGGEITYRVRIGPYAELLQAQEMAQEVFDEDGKRPLILPTPAPHEVGDDGN
ncbi:MAG TPA: SPOR domain-containing protein [Terriglobales bacterium]|nr:SPOR domain-containing protein [Terriglobales bacterium]